MPYFYKLLESFNANLNLDSDFLNYLKSDTNSSRQQEIINFKFLKIIKIMNGFIEFYLL